MAKARTTSQRNLFREVASGVRAMREHREGRLTLRTLRVEPIARAGAGSGSFTARQPLQETQQLPPRVRPGLTLRSVVF